MPLGKPNLSELPLHRRAIKGVKWGLQMAAGFALFAVLARLLGGDRIFEGGLSFPQTLAAEFGAGILGGLVLGLCLPILTSSVNVAFVGFAIGAIAGFATLMAQKGFAGWDMVDLIVVIVYSFVGLAVAVLLRRRVTQSPKL